MNYPRFLTKVRLPQRRADVLRRPRLVDFLHQHVDKRLIIVCASAGYGKTTLMVDFAHDVGLPTCWYSMDAADADPRTFFEYLILSLRQRFPSFGRQTELLLDSVEDVGREVNSVVASLTSEIQSEIPDYFLLVLDDFHWVNGSEAINSAVDLLVYYLPDNCHLVLSTRSLPHLTFSRLAAQRQAVGLGTSDLRFTTDELTRLLRDNYKLSMPAHQAQQLIDASEGWITGILLTTHTLWMGLVESLVKAKGAESPLFDYLANEAYLHQQPETQQFLLSSSVLDLITPERCDRLFANGASPEVLRYLLRANLFIEQIEGPGEWYRYHNLFHDFLRARLKTDDPILYAQLHQRAGWMAEDEGDWDSALDHYRCSGDVDREAALVERVGEEMMKSGRWQTLNRWLDSLPQPVIDSTARLSLYRGRTYIRLGELDRAIIQLEQASRRFSLLGDLSGAAGALSLKSVGLRFKGRLQESIEVSGEALALQSDQNTRVAADAHRDIGICLASLGKPEEAAAELQRALEICETTADEEGKASICQAIGLLSVQTGNLARGMAYYQRALDSLRAVQNVALTAGVLNCIASVYHCTGEYQQALPVLEDALSGARKAGNLRSEAFALATLGDVRRDSGNPQQALESYEAALEIAQRIDELQLVNYLLDALANAHRLLGEYQTAERLLRQAIQQAEENQSPYEMATYSVSAGVLAEELGDLDRADASLRAAIANLATFGARRELARARFHLARVLLERGNQEGAARETEECLALCRQLGYDQFMVAEGQRAGKLVAWATGRGLGGRRLALVAERLQVTRPAARASKPQVLRVEPVNPREIRVYSLGETKVLVDSRMVTSGEWAVEKTKELFYYLLEHPQNLRKEQIVDALWPELELGKSNSQFHSTIYRLRRALFPQCVAYQDGRYRLALGKQCWFDADEFANLLDEAEARDVETSRRESCYEGAVALYRGPFLEELYSDWVVPYREELEQRYLQALTRLARLRAETGTLDEASVLLRTVVSADPFREEAHYGLIHYAALMGDRAGALRHYKSYVELLRDELRARPSATILALADSIARGQPVPSL